jgi:hypothetical protein
MALSQAAGRGRRWGAERRVPETTVALLDASAPLWGAPIVSQTRQLRREVRHHCQLMLARVYVAGSRHLREELPNSTGFVLFARRSAW